MFLAHELYLTTIHNRHNKQKNKHKYISENGNGNG